MRGKLSAKFALTAAIGFGLACGTYVESDGQPPATPSHMLAEPTAELRDQIVAPPSKKPTLEMEQTLPHSKDPTIEELLRMEKWFNTADLGIEITSGIEKVVPGQQVIYKISVSGSGPNPADAIRVTVVLPDGITYHDDTALCDVQATGRLLCDLGGFPSGTGERDFLVAAVVNEDLLMNTDLTTNVSTENRVIDSLDRIPGLSAWPDPDSENNTAADTIRVTVPDPSKGDQKMETQLWTEPIHLQEEHNTTDLKLVMYSNERDGMVIAGLDFEYGFLVANGSNPARDVRLSIDLPEDATYQPNGENCVENGPFHLDCLIGEMKIHERAEISIQMLSDVDLGKGVDGAVIISGEATVKNLSGPDPDPSNNTASAISRVKHDVDIRDHILDRRARGLN